MEYYLSILFYYILVPLFILGIAINIHEFGHFIVARLFGMRVEAYSFFGLGPRVWGFKRGHTDYRISAIPLGAYVKLYGDEATAALEGGESEGEKVPDSELYELRPRWQKFFVMLGGPFMNIMLSLAIPFFGGLVSGVPGTPPPVIAEIRQDSAAQTSGLEVGDRIVSFNGVENPEWRRIQLDAAISPEKPIPVTVERLGKKIDLQVVPRKVMISGGQEVGELDFRPDLGASPTVIGNVEPGTPAADAGIQSGDIVLAVNGETLRSPQQFGAAIQENKDAPIKLTIERDGQTMDLTAQPKLLDDGKIRLGVGYAKAQMPLEKATISSAAEHAFNANYDVLRLTGNGSRSSFYRQTRRKRFGNCRTCRNFPTIGTKPRRLPDGKAFCIF